MSNLSHPMQQIKDLLKGILNVIPKKSNVIYLDYPVYENIGDILIMKGTEKFFKDNDINVISRYSFINFPNKLKIPKDTIIVFQGGGNFGDLYFGPQQLREKVIEHFPNNKVVILPQTVYFNELSNEINTFNILRKHNNLYFFVRDKRSFDIVKKYINNVELMPDMAHQLWPIKPLISSTKDILLHIRTDNEKNDRSLKGFEKCDQIDWPTLINKKDMKRILLYVKLHKISKYIGFGNFLNKSWQNYTDLLVNKAVSVYSNYDKIVTSRLHGHILACLLDKRNVVLDNSYGKNNGYYYEWTCTLPNASNSLGDLEN